MQEIDLPDRDRVLIWLSRNQLARRNISRDEFTYHLGKLYEAAKRQGERTDLTSGHFDQKLGEADRFADEYQVSEKTVRRAAEYARAVDRIAELKERSVGEIVGERTPRSELIRQVEAEDLASTVLSSTVRSRTNGTHRPSTSNRRGP